MGGNPNPNNSEPPAPWAAGGGPAPPWTTDGGMPQPAHGGGAWQEQTGSWVWVSGSNPDPNRQSAWGSETLTDPPCNPNGGANYGAWLFSGHQQVWVWGAKPHPSEVGKYAMAALTNPNNYPSNGAPVPAGSVSPAPPDVAPPTVTDTANGVAPSLTGNVPPSGIGANNGTPGLANMSPVGPSQNIAPASGQPSQPVNQPPPSHPAYVVSPGAIRNQQTCLLNQIDIHIGGYDNLKNSGYQAV